MRIKFCGITRVEDAVKAAELGVDAIGLVFYPGSPRCVSIEQAQYIIQALPAFISPVGLFVDADKSTIEQVIAAMPIGYLQFHADEAESFCQQFGIPYLKTIRMRTGIDEAFLQQAYPSAAALLLDAYNPQQAGGTGETFDWQLIPKKLNRPYILAGGLNTTNIKQAVKQCHPYGVDVSSGIESAPGIKDHGKMQGFIRELYLGKVTL